MNVYPRKPLEAERIGDSTYVGISLPTMWAGAPVADAEFAAHFYPAERLDALLAALETWYSGPYEEYGLADVRAAFEAFQQQDADA